MSVAFIVIVFAKIQKKGFLSASQAKTVLEQAKALGAVSTTITGGESLLNPEWKHKRGHAQRCV